MELDVIDIVALCDKPITIVYPSKINSETYAFDFETRYYNKYKALPKVKYTMYKNNFKYDEDYVIDPLCYKLEIKKRDAILDGLLKEIEDGKRNLGYFS